MTVVADPLWMSAVKMIPVTSPIQMEWLLSRKRSGTSRLFQRLCHQLQRINPEEDQAEARNDKPCAANVRAGHQPESHADEQHRDGKRLQFQCDQLCRHRCAQIGPEDDADRLGELDDARIGQADGQDGYGAGALQDKRGDQSDPEAMVGRAGEARHPFFHFLPARF